MVLGANTKLKNGGYMELKEQLKMNLDLATKNVDMYRKLRAGATKGTFLYNQYEINLNYWYGIQNALEDTVKMIDGTFNAADGIKYA
jgi:hypothetical protein